MSLKHFIPDDPEKAKPRIAIIYRAIIVGIVLPQCLLMYAARGWLNPTLVDWCAWASYCTSFLSITIADRACRRRGISQRSEHRETIRRDPSAATEPLSGEAPALWVGKPNKPLARIGREGMERRRWRGGPLLVAWRDVEWCTYDTSRDVAGYQNPAWLTLWDGNRKKLLELRLKEEQADKLLPAIRFYLRGEGIREEPAGT